jgi:hypothetical protein
VFLQIRCAEHGISKQIDATQAQPTIARAVLMKSKTASRAEQALKLFRQADRLERKKPVNFSEQALNPLYARNARAEGHSLLSAPPQLVGSSGTELVPTPEDGEEVSQSRAQFLETLAEPNVISVSASEQRARVATEAGIMSAAVDAAVCGRAANSIERMLCHQLAAAHMSSMNLIARLERSPNLPHVDAARLTNAAARLIEVYQAGCLTLQKLKTGGRQHVLVQYQQQVNVGNGGRALVAGKMQQGSRRAMRRK